MDNKKLKSIAKFLIKLLLTILAFWITFRGMEMSALKAVFAKINYGYVLLAILFFIIAKFWEAQRLNLFYKDAGINLSWLTNFKLYILGMFYSLFLPGGIGGDGYRVYWVKKKQDEIALKEVIKASLLNRLNGLLILLCILCISAVFVSIEFPLKSYVPLLAAVGLLAYFIFIHLFFSGYKKNIFLTSFYSLLVHSFQTVSVIFILFSVSIFSNFFDYWFVFMTSNIATVLPITVGGFGARELVLKEASNWFEMLPNFAVSVGLIFNIVRALVSFLGIYFLVKPTALED